jgi:hypothetical protein
VWLTDAAPARSTMLVQYVKDVIMKVIISGMTLVTPPRNWLLCERVMLDLSLELLVKTMH